MARRPATPRARIRDRLHLELGQTVLFLKPFAVCLLWRWSIVHCRRLMDMREFAEGFLADPTKDLQLQGRPNDGNLLVQRLQTDDPIHSVGQTDEVLFADLALSCEFLLEGWLATNVTSLTDR
jgi:hypothetical protein